MEAGSPKSKQAFVEIALVFALFAGCFALTSAGFDTSEGGYHYAIARQILSHGTMSFAEPRPGIYTIAPNGRTYASHEIGNTLFLLPVAGVNLSIEKLLNGRVDPRRTGFVEDFLITMMSVLYCALATALLYGILRIYFERDLRTSLTCCLAFAFSTFVWTYSRNLFDGVLCMVLLTGALFSMLQFRKTGKIGLFILSMVLLGTAVITRLTMVLAVIAFALYLVCALWHQRAWLVRLLAGGAVILVPFAMWQMFYSHLRTGHFLISPMQSGQYAANSLNGNLLAGISGYLFSPGKSIFVYMPLAILSIVAFRDFAAKYQPEAVLIASLSIFWILVHSRLAIWYGSWGWGPRYFITIAPFLVLPSLVSWEWLMERRWRRIAVVCALAWGTTLSAASIIGNWHYRMFLAYTDNRFDAMNWSLRQGQAVDMLRGAVSNFLIMIEHRPIPELPDFSPINRYASNTVNVWMNSAAYAGVPKALIVLITLILAAIVVWCWVALHRVETRQDQKALPPTAVASDAR